MECIITFESTHQAISAEKSIKYSGVKANLIPTPRKISASCGLSLMFNANELERVIAVIRENTLDIGDIYLKKDDSNIVKAEYTI